MQITPKEILPCLERSGSICFVDIETSGTKGDYNSILLASVKAFGGDVTTFCVQQVGDDRSVVRALRDYMNKFTVWVTFYGKGFDIPFINTRLWRYRMKPLERRHHIDMYYVLRGSTLTARRSQAHLLRFLNAPLQKLTLSPELWNEVLKNPQRGLRILKKRCESDVAGLEQLYCNSRGLIKEITR